MRNNRWTIIIIILVSSLGLIKYFFLSNKEMKNAGGKQKKMPISVSVYITGKQSIAQQYFVSGSMLANEEVDLSFETAGRITDIFFTEGTAVQKGQLLASLNNSELQAQLKKVLEQQKLVQEKEERLKKLVQINGVSKEEYDYALNSVNGLKADHELLLAQLAKTQLKAPFDGWIGLREVSVGSNVSSATKIASLSQLNPLKLDFSLPERYLNTIKKDAKIQFAVDGMNEKFTATIIAIEPGIDVATRSIKVRASCQNNHNKLRPGAFAKIEMMMNESESGIFIPTQALIPVLKGHKVYIKKNNVVDETKVIIGIRTYNKIQILEGLSAGDTVITSGIQKIKKGAELKIEGIDK